MKTLSRIALAMLSFVLAVLAAEGLHRLWLWSNDATYRAHEAREQLLNLADPSRAFVPESSIEDEAPEPEEAAPAGKSTIVLHPYTGGEGSHDTGAVLEYFRDLERPKDFSVLVLGGSFAASFSNEPRFLERLREAPVLAGRRVKVLNYAHDAYKQPQQLMRLAYLFSLGYRPDAVINLDGFNEVALPQQGLPRGIHPVYPQYIRWGIGIEGIDQIGEREMQRRLSLFELSVRADELVAQSEAWGLHRSSLLGGLCLSRMREINARRFELLQDDDPEPTGEVDRQIQGPDFDPRPQAVLEVSAKNWAESSISMAAMCEARGIPYLHVLQPTLHDEGAKAVSDAELALPLPNKGWLRGARDGYPLLRKKAAAIEAAGVNFRDASRFFEHETRTIYIDACHLNRTGNRLLVEPVVAWFTELLE